MIAATPSARRAAGRPVVARRCRLAGNDYETGALSLALILARSGGVLAQGEGRVLAHETLLRQGLAERGMAEPKIVCAYVMGLGLQLRDDAARRISIFNERGVGYRMARPGKANAPKAELGTPSITSSPR